eukprot:TRINITY_DN1605_c0_g1_i2.p1 TRINITY_DN1605_c0_g1~~TRINITY_DN1605_c0_g1_i2.p1  ORF type:complete len:166 (+),score=49.53 TRINITY_DN1605_c0_g1_i2:29-499(+)
MSEQTSTTATSSEASEVCVDCVKEEPGNVNQQQKQPHQEIVQHKTPRIEITYCVQCRWMLRAAWLAQELLTTFGNIIGEMVLVPGQNAVFEVRVGNEVIWDRKKNGGFPEVKDVKQLIRDRIAPEMSLGHSDKKTEKGAWKCKSTTKTTTSRNSST